MAGPVTIYSQDDPSFPDTAQAVVDDTALENSYRQKIEVVPTLLRMVDGVETGRIIGWNQAEWQSFTGLAELGASLPAAKPGCGAKNVLPGIAEELALRYGDSGLKARQIEIATLEDEIEACFDRGWSDGLPVVPPTALRVLRMLAGTTRPPDEIIALAPPNDAPATVEKIAINAVMAGCKPEYLPVVIAAVEAACDDAFCMRGVLATTWFSGPIVVVNGPIRQRIGMNSGVNALGQGNRANATIGRALQLVIRNVGGGRPGEIDRAVLGNPGKLGYCFAENEELSPWESWAEQRGVPAGRSAVTLFAGDGLQGIMDQISRTPESLAGSYAASLRSILHPKLALASDAMLIITPEHSRLFREAGWSKQRLNDEIMARLQIPRAELERDAAGIMEGTPASRMGNRALVPKFRAGGLHIVHVGGTAGMFSAIIGGWPNSGERGTAPVTREIKA